MNAYGVAVTPQNVFWGDFTDNAVGRANIDGTAPNNLFAVPGTGDAATPYLLAASPSNSFTLGKAKLNKRSGIAKLAVTVPGPGVLVADAASRGPQAIASKKQASTVKPVGIKAKAA